MLLPRTMTAGMDVARRFTDRVAMITGAGSGIGRACALRLGGEGAAVAVLDLDLKTGQQTVDLLQEEGCDAIALRCDVSRPEQVEEAVSACIDRFGRIDALHNNAGVLIPGSALTQRLEDWDLHFAVNVRGMLLMARRVIPHMQRQGRGAIVNTASTAGLAGEANCVAYDSSKGAVVSLTRQLAIDFAKAGIRVNCICPGWIETGFNDPILEEAQMTDEDVAALVGQSIPMQRQGVAEEVAPAVAFLLSDDAAYITGHALVIDGGLLAQ